MRIVVQRVTHARVTVEGSIVGEIGNGVVLLVGIETADTPDDVPVAAAKIADLRIFADDEGRMNRSLVDVGGEALVVSQFTLAADVRKGRRPSFTRAAAPEVAEPLVEAFSADLGRRGVQIEQGRFGAMMDVALVNDGPVTIVIDVDRGSVQ